MITIEYILKSDMHDIKPDSWRRARFETFNMANDWLNRKAGEFASFHIYQTIEWELEDVAQLAEQELYGEVGSEYALALIGR